VVIWGGNMLLIIGGFGRVYARNHPQIREILNEPAQPHQPISIVIRSSGDDNVRSIWIYDDDI
jgi:hypothetical protein